LVIERKEGEGLFIGRGVRVVVVEVTDTGRVRLGIEAPRNVAVSRDGAFTSRQHAEFQRAREIATDEDREDTVHRGRA
jgi:carbon storage regulator CsrA